MIFKPRYRFTGRDESGLLRWERVTRYGDYTGLVGYVTHPEWFYGMMVKR